MAPPKRKVDLSPPELTLDLTSSASPSTQLQISNPSQEHLVFKVRTTNPKRYLVKPNQDILPAGASITVTIQMQARECSELLETGLEDSQSKDKFMVSCVVVDDLFLRNAKTAKESGPKDVQNLHTELWASRQKDDISNRRLACSLIFPTSAGMSKAVSPAPVASSAATPSNLNGTEKKATSTTPATAAPATTPPNYVSPSPTLERLAVPSAPPSVVASTVSNVQTPSKKADEKIESTPLSQPSDASAAFETLGKQHRETMATLVQVTEERDRFQVKFREATKELVQLKEDARTSRKGGKFGDFEGADTLTNSKLGNYQLWHLIIVAMVSFLVSRLVQFVFKV